MTMQHQIHPDDERLAALAGADPDAVADAELRGHVTSCTRCADLVDEVATLRTALAELPDLVPSRPLQLLPPVAEPRVAGGSWLRRLAAPIMAGGFGLVLVGAIGTSGILNALPLGGAASAPGPMEERGTPLITGGESPVVDMQSIPRSVSSSRDGLAAGGSGNGRTDDASGEWQESDESQGPEESTAEVAPQAAGQPDADGSRGLFSTTDARLPWLVLIGLGVGLLLAGVYLRFSTQPRAG